MEHIVPALLGREGAEAAGEVAGEERDLVAEARDLHHQPARVGAERVRESGLGRRRERRFCCLCL